MLFIKNILKRKKSIEKVEKSEESEKWNNKAEYMLSLIGYSVGIGNIWRYAISRKKSFINNKDLSSTILSERFPAMCYRNGGGAFLIPYFIMYFCAGLPCYYLELSIGQFTGRSVVASFEMAPLLKGI
jgi:SNF family Na+-dependent transporter